VTLASSPVLLALWLEKGDCISHGSARVCSCAKDDCRHPQNPSVIDATAIAHPLALSPKKPLRPETGGGAVALALAVAGGGDAGLCKIGWCTQSLSSVAAGAGER
jgi:hypothetical protein